MSLSVLHGRANGLMKNQIYESDDKNVKFDLDYY
jgi:hypothetical protein